MRLLRPLILVSLHAFAASPTEIRASAQRSITLIQKVNAQWKLPCFSCHHQTLGDLALATARAHGLEVDEKLALASSTRTYKRLLDLDGAIRIDELIDPAASEGSMLLGALSAGVQPNLATAAYARHIAGTQKADGHWDMFDTRPPQGASNITATAVASRAISHYLPEPFRQSSLRRARAWLAKAKSFDTEDASMRVLGLHWTGASSNEIRSAVTQLTKLQHPDGSWSQTPTSKSPDAYATGQALYAITVVTGKPSQSAIDWLLANQAPDGSFHVKSRIRSIAPVSPPYFESGFPYGHDQFISAAATALAVCALAESLPLSAKPSTPLSLPAFDDSKLSWAKAALFGTVADLEKIDPNAATPGGTTSLMMAANDPAKVEYLLKKGVNAKVTTDAGIDALMIAALYQGNTRTLELLIKAGANPNPTQKVRFDAKALVHAAIANDPANVEFLLANKANPNGAMRLLGGSPFTPMMIAASFGNPAIIRALVKSGVRVDTTDRETGMTPLGIAALAFRGDAVKALLDLGADPRHKDSFGLTPYDHTQLIDDTPRQAAIILKVR